MSDRKKNRTGRLKNFFQYHRNALPGVERNSFERELQKDPFTEDAMQGFDSLSPAEANKDYSDLHKRMNRKINSNKSSLYYRIAVSIIIILGIASIIVLTTQKKSNDSVALNSEQQKPIEITKGLPLRKPEREIKSPAPGITRKTEAGKGAVNNLNDSNKDDKTLNAYEDRSEKKLPEIQPEKENTREKLNENILAESKTADEINSKAEISQPGSSMARSRSIIAKDSNDDTSTILNEVIITGSDSGTDTYIPPQPLIAKTEFDKYIRENIRRPYVTSSRREIVIVNLLIHTDGSFGKFNILKSPGELYSNEAIRLIKSGPGWKPAENNGTAVEDSVRIRIVFR